MVTSHALDRKSARGRPRRSEPFYSSKRLAATVVGDGRVTVDLSIGEDAETRAALKEAAAAAMPKSAGAKLGEVAATRLAAALEKVAARFFGDALSSELDKLVSEYRLMLRENLAKGDDASLKAALNRARLQERILASTAMADQSQACELLGLSGVNPSATMKRKEDNRELLRFTVDGRAVYPLLQFDVERRRLYPVLRDIIARKPDDWSDFRLLHWLTRPHLDFDVCPAASLGEAGDAVLAAFGRAIEPEVHG